MTIPNIPMAKRGIKGAAIKELAELIESAARAKEILETYGLPLPLAGTLISKAAKIERHIDRLYHLVELEQTLKEVQNGCSGTQSSR